MIAPLNEEWIIALLPPILIVASQAVHSLGHRYRTYTTARCIARMASMITSCEEPRDEVIRGLQLRYSTNTILESAIFIAEHIYGNSLYRLTTIIEVCEVDYHLLRAMHKGGAKERASLLARLSRLSHIGSMVGFAEEGLRDTEREVQLYATATLIASHPERAIGYIAKLKAPLSLYEVAILTQLMRRAGTPIAYTPLLLSDNRNLQYTGIYICAQLAIVDAEEHLQRLISSGDGEISLAALNTLCSLRGDLTTPSARLAISRLTPPLRQAFIRHAVQSCYSLQSCAQLLDSDERRQFSQRVESFKCRIICN